MKTIQQEWEGFWNMVKPKNPSATQMREMKKAFFSGALTAYTQLDKAGQTLTLDAEETAALHMEACFAETVEFHKTMIREYTERN